ncbi:MAG: glycerol-3-phosphate dehydrogenase/oxidase [Oligoflexia bacterium]|nr:glycerol-3-phosphate dehydrogenase/oxidase [Oligoflexia bacterium]
MDVLDREQQIQSLQDSEFDLLVLGGGITGAGIARDAAMRGLKVALVEANDFCSGTSSKSSKLLHGGIRYLEQFHLHLVFEASQERRLHSQILSPHLAKPVPFLIPIYPWSPHGRMAMSAGVFLYDLLALFRNHGTRHLSKDKVLKEENLLASSGLKGGVVYHDVVMDDARLGLENIRSAQLHSALVVNYVLVRGFEKKGESDLYGVWAKDSLSNQADFLIRAKAIVNATGPWCDYIRKLADPDVESYLRPTKGVHILFPNHVLGKSHAFVLTSNKDDRVFFSIPWFDRTLVGTTDTDYNPIVDGGMDEIKANENEIDYLMEGVKRTFPEASIRSSDILSTFAGLRPLVKEIGSSNPSAVSREHKIWVDSSGLYNIAGGKYTTYRNMAKQMVDFVIKKMKSKHSQFGNTIGCNTAFEPLVLPSSKKNLEEHMQEYRNNLGDETLLHLQSRYGARWQLVADIALETSDGKEKIVEGETDILAEARYAKKFEMARTSEDFLRRRTMLALKAKNKNLINAIQKIQKEFPEENITESTIKKIQGLEWQKT